MNKKSKELKVPMQHEYDGTCCPQCNAEGTIEGDSFTAGDQSAWQKVYCTVCGASWDDLYKLVGFDNLKDEEGDETPMPTAKVYTVILFHNDGNNTTWMEYVTADSPEEAVDEAKKMWATSYYAQHTVKLDDGETIDNLIAELTNEYTCIACIEGEHNDVKPN